MQQNIFGHLATQSEDHFDLPLPQLTQRLSDTSNSSMTTSNSAESSTSNE
jgi:hypothetical protein